MFFYDPDDSGNSAPISPLATAEIKIIKVIDAEGKTVKILKADTEYTYVCNQKANEINDIHWAFWIDKKDKSFEFEYTVEVIVNTNKEENTTDFFISSKADGDNQKKEENTQLLTDNAILSSTLSTETHKIGEVDKEVAVLKVKYSKWLDGEKVRMEVYKYNRKDKKGKPTRNEGKDAVCSRTVAAKPEVAEIYWMGADGEKLAETGYSEDIYLYIKTLGLKDKILELNVYDEDIKPSTNPSTEEDDIISWEGNKIKIEERNSIKQFKVGIKDRYEEAQKDEVENEETKEVVILETPSYEAPHALEHTEILYFWFDYFNNCSTIEEVKQNPEILELYVHVNNANKTKVKGEDEAYALDLNLTSEQNKFGKIKLTPKEQIVDAFFAIDKSENIIADLPLIKEKNQETSIKNLKKQKDVIVGQKIKIVAECDNLNGQDISFSIKEIEANLKKEDKTLTVMQNGKPVTEICATVKDGYAVAEVEIQEKAEKSSVEEWTKILKDKESKLKLIVEHRGAITTKKEFLEKDNFLLKPSFLIFPLKKKPLNYEGKDFEDYDFTEDQGDSMATYKANRGGGTRKHAARDLYTEELTEVLAMTKGRVLRVAYFYDTTYQVTIEHFYQHKEGYNLVLRYGEMDKNTIKVKVGDIVEQGDVIGKTGKLVKKDGTNRLTLKNKTTQKSQVIYMLHLEAYTGKKGVNLKTNSLSGGTSTFKRRSDLFDALDILKPAFKNSFNEDL